MKNFFKDFKAFISKGNIVDLAVAVVIGSAFGKIVTSLVNDLIMPLISAIVGNINFADLKWVIKPADELNGITEVAFKYGNFIQTFVDFLIISFFIFLILRILMNSKNSFAKLENQVRKSFITKEDKELLKSRNIDLKDKKACLLALAEIQKEEADKKALEEMNKPKIENQEDILKDIRLLLQKNLEQNSKKEQQ